MSHILLPKSNIILIFTSPDLIPNNLLTENFKDPFNKGEVVIFAQRYFTLIIAYVKNNRTELRNTEQTEKLISTTK